MNEYLYVVHSVTEKSITTMWIMYGLICGYNVTLDIKRYIFVSSVEATAMELPTHFIPHALL